MNQRTYGTRRSGRGIVVAVIIILIAMVVLAFVGWWLPLRQRGALAPSIIPTQHIVRSHPA